MPNYRNKDFQHGMPLQTIIIVMIAIGAVISFFLLFSMYKTTESYNSMRTATQDYIDCQNSAFALQNGSDYLMNRARSFVVTGNPEQANLYFNEVQVEKSRDKAVEEVKAHLVDERAQKHLDTALTLSDQLMETENYAMRLVIEAKGYDPREFPDTLQAVRLSEEDLALPAEEKLERARDMVFDDAYENAKEQIDTRVSLCMQVLIDSLLNEQVDSSDRLLDLLHSQQMLIAGLMISLLIIAIIIFSLVINPLRQQISNISREQMMDEKGTTELQFLARTYNRMFEQTQKAQEKLSYEATHDPLTGLYNRSAYDDLREKCARQNVALLLIDVDHFKTVNDTYGHDVGDKVLMRVADVLRSSFRGEDMVCRIGGDEFSVIMVNATSTLTELVRNKIARAAEKLANPTDDVPSVTLSVGVAFTDQKAEGEDLFKNADRALYQVKMKGRNGCGFYVAPDDSTPETSD